MTFRTSGIKRKSRLSLAASVALAMVLGGLFSLAVTSPAQASCTKAGIHLGQPYKSGSQVRGMSFLDSNCSANQRFTVFLEREGFLDWPTVAQGTLTVNGALLLSWNCSGRTYTYRQRTACVDVGGTPCTVKSATIRFSC